MTARIGSRKRPRIELRHGLIAAGLVAVLMVAAWGSFASPADVGDPATPVDAQRATFAPLPRGDAIGDVLDEDSPHVTYTQTMPSLIPGASGAVTTTETSLAKDCGETSLDHDPNAPQHIAVVGNGYGGAGSKGCLWYTTDQGTSWTRTTETAGTSPTSGDPHLAYNNNSKVFGVRMDGVIGLDVWKSSNDGSTITNVYNALDRTTSVTFPDSSTRAPCMVDYPQIGVDDFGGSSYTNRIYVSTAAYYNMSGSSCPSTNFGDYTGYLTNAISTDSGVTWTRKVPDTNFRAHPEDVMIAPNGHVYLSFVQSSCGAPPGSIGYAKSTDGGSTWSSFVCLVDGDDPVHWNGGRCGLGSDTVAIAVGRNDADKVYFAFEGYDAAWKLNIYVKASTDGGANWGAPVKVNTPLDSDYRCRPMISVAPSGRVDVAWWDFRNVVGTDSGDVYYSYSNDGGATFATDIRLTPAAYPWQHSHWQDYDNIISVNTKAFVAYTQVRSGSAATMYVNKIVH